ncbi:MAG: hypothetical protein R2873_36460 [Caldilineaceae bacterium]
MYDGQPLSPSNTLLGGDATGIVGVLTYTWAGNSASGAPACISTAQATASPMIPTPRSIALSTSCNPRPESAPDVGSALKVASFNVLNYFVTLDTGAAICGPNNVQDCRELGDSRRIHPPARQTAQPLLKLDADVVGLIELENTLNAEPLADIVSQTSTGCSATLSTISSTLAPSALARSKWA